MDLNLLQDVDSGQCLSEDGSATKEHHQKGLNPDGPLIANGLDGSVNVPDQDNIVDSGIAGDSCSVREGDVESRERTSSLSDSEREQGPVSGDIFSPDSADMVTVICNDAEEKAEHEEGDRAGCNGSDTHSDSIETLEEESPQEDSKEDSQEGLRDSILQQMCLAKGTGQNQEGREEGQAKETAVSLTPKGTDQAVDDSQSTDSREVFTDISSGASRPESLSLPRPLQHYERQRSCSEPQQNPAHAWAVRAEASAGHQRTRSEAIDIHGVKVKGDLSYGDDIMSRSLPHGTLTRKGVLVEFVADDLTEKIKRSSPMSGTESSSMGSRRSSQRSLASTSSATSAATSSGVSRSPSSLLTQSPDAAPPIDPSAIMELEMAARRVADNVDHMMGNLRNNLHKMSAITVGCSEAYKTSVDITCESVDSSIKSMYALMAKCEELSKTMSPVYQIATQIKEIKRLLERFEAQLSEKA